MFSKHPAWFISPETIETCGLLLKYVPSLEDVGWPEDAQFIFLISHTFVCNIFFPRSIPRLDVRPPSQILQALSLLKSMFQ